MIKSPVPLDGPLSNTHRPVPNDGRLHNGIIVVREIERAHGKNANSHLSYIEEEHVDGQNNGNRGAASQRNQYKLCIRRTPLTRPILNCSRRRYKSR